MKAGYTRRALKEQQWADTIRAWEQSGLTKKAFCERESINYYTLLRWCKRLGTGEGTNYATSFVEVGTTAVPVFGGHPIEGHRGEAIEIALEGARIRVPAGVSREHLEVVIAAVTGAPC